jgi:hypothetical protein
MSIVAEAVAFDASVAVTVKLVIPCAALGVPDKTPVIVLKLIPAGKVPPEIEYVIVPVNPVVLTVVDVIGVLTVPVIAAVLRDNVAAPGAVTAILIEAVAERVPSVAVMVNGVDASVVLGVPERTPVEVKKSTPVGS